MAFNKVEARAYRLLRKEAGFCTSCLKRRPKKGRVTCAYCIRRINDSRRVRRQLLAGIVCRECGTETSSPLCPKHRKKLHGRSTRRYQRHKTDELCVSCGGVNPDAPHFVECPTCDNPEKRLYQKIRRGD